MDLKQFAALVAEMRRTQKEYFSTRDHDVLGESKRLERQVDLALIEISQPQQGLFDKDGQ
jgi:hypothetical protein